MDCLPQELNQFGDGTADFEQCMFKLRAAATKADGLLQRTYVLIDTKKFEELSRQEKEELSLNASTALWEVKHLYAEAAALKKKGCFYVVDDKCLMDKDRFSPIVRIKAFDGKCFKTLLDVKSVFDVSLRARHAVVYTDASRKCYRLSRFDIMVDGNGTHTPTRIGWALNYIENTAYEQHDLLVSKWAHVKREFTCVADFYVCFGIPPSEAMSVVAGPLVQIASLCSMIDADVCETLCLWQTGQHDYFWEGVSENPRAIIHKLGLVQSLEAEI